MMETKPEIIGPINLGNPDEFTIRELAEIDLGFDRLTLEDSPPPAATR
jgi:UDP-glucuronate decarboxylase